MTLLGATRRPLKAEKGLWWDVAGWEKGEAASNILILMDFGMMLKRYRQRSLAVVSQGFSFFIEFVCGRNWENRYRKALKAMTAAKRSQETAT